MTRRKNAQQKTPWKSALAKPAFSNSAVGRGIAQTHKPASKAELAEALVSRPRLDFRDPIMRYAAMEAKGVSLCAFLVTLAAFQRGLKVTFHNERASFDPRFAKAKIQGHRGELFSITHGTRTHNFSRTMGDLTTPTASVIAKDKHLTKVALKRAGVRTPEGIVVERNSKAIIEKFLVLHSHKRFVVKPNDGSLSKDVYASVSHEDVLLLMHKHWGGRILVEEYVPGREYRAAVVGGRCIAISWRERPSINGDGNSTVRQLINALKKNLSENNPHWDALKDEGVLSKFLSRSNHSLDSVLEKGFWLCVSNTADGAIHHDVTDVISSKVKRKAEIAADAVGLVNCGIDLIVCDDASVCVLEVNQRPYIGSHSFPSGGESLGQGNAVAEAIVDYYFPETIRDRTRSTLAYNFAPVRAALASMTINELSLPVIGPDWKVLRLAVDGDRAIEVSQLFLSAARTVGVFVFTAPRDEGSVELCLAYAPANFRNMLSVLPVQLRHNLQQLDAQVGA